MDAEDRGFESLSKIVSKPRKNKNKLPKFKSVYIKLLNKANKGEGQDVASSSTSGFDTEEFESSDNNEDGTKSPGMRTVTDGSQMN